MEVYHNLVKQDSPTAVALGFFDGMHLGHQKIISKAVEFKKDNLQTCVLTFEQNPRAVVENCKVDLLMTQEQKLAAMHEAGVDVTYMLNFNDIRYMPPKKFVEKVLCETLNAKIVVCGFNYHFGFGGNAGAEDLQKFCKNYGICAFVEAAVMYKDRPISSTRIRNAIKNQEFVSAKNMLFEK